MASRSLPAAEACAARWDIPRAYGSYEELLADPDIDIVYVPVPNHLHADWAVRCAEAGKHVLCEKPLALTPREVDRMAQAARRHGVVVQEAAMMRFHPQMELLREWVAGGAIGRITLVRGIFTFTLEREGDIRWSPEMGGGSLWDLGSYCVSFMRAVLQAEPEEVFAQQVTSASGVDLSLSAQLRFPGGTLAHFLSSFAAFPHIEADLLGTAGRITADLPWANHPGRPAHLNLIRRAAQAAASTFGDSLEGQSLETRSFEGLNAYQTEVESMTASVLDGAPPVISLADSRGTVAVINALHESAAARRPVTLSGAAA